MKRPRLCNTLFSSPRRVQPNVKEAQCDNLEESLACILVEDGAAIHGVRHNEHPKARDVHLPLRLVIPLLARTLSALFAPYIQASSPPLFTQGALTYIVSSIPPPCTLRSKSPHALPRSSSLTTYASTSKPAMPFPYLQLVRALNRPAFVEVQCDAILAVEPNVGQVPFWIHPPEPPRAWRRTHGVAQRRKSAPVARPRASPSFDIVPAHGTAPLTHILAVHSSPSSKHPVSDAVFLVPTHHIVLPAHCTHILRLSVSHAQPRPGGTLALPAMPLVVPQAEAFAPLHVFLVAHRADRLVGALLPLPPAMLAPARASGSAAAVSAPQATAYLAADAAGDKMSGLMELTWHVAEGKAALRIFYLPSHAHLALRVYSGFPSATRFAVCEMISVAVVLGFDA
ncbi:hypothetical protein BC834DRAFT_988945 [Gloeopeniophorella convolvens]|nr:hypothetical protein BC834DRAFT_988945 [Gloeopeniophorella convolvens]